MLTIRDKRKALKITQLKLAETMGVKRNTISQWETGSRHPDHDKIPALAAALGCSIDELYGKEG